MLSVFNISHINPSQTCSKLDTRAGTTHVSNVRLECHSTFLKSMTCNKTQLLQTGPVNKHVEVLDWPFLNGEVVGHFLPVPLSFIIAEHGRFPRPWWKIIEPSEWIPWSLHHERMATTQHTRANTFLNHWADANYRKSHSNKVKTNWEHCFD